MKRDVWKLIENMPPEYPGIDNLDPVIVALMACQNQDPDVGFKQLCCTWRAWQDPETFCPFCQKEMTRRQRQILAQVGRWILFENEFPRKSDADRMLLIAPIRHVVSLDELDRDDWGDKGMLVKIAREHGYTGGGLVMRDGDPRDHAGTIEHIHENAIRPKREMGMSVPLGKLLEGKYGYLEDYRRFTKEYLPRIVANGGVGWLFSPKGIEETQPKMMAA